MRARGGRRKAKEIAAWQGRPRERHTCSRRASGRLPGQPGVKTPPCPPSTPPADGISALAEHASALAKPEKRGLAEMMCGLLAAPSGRGSANEGASGAGSGGDGKRARGGPPGAFWRRRGGGSNAGCSSAGSESPIGSCSDSGDEGGGEEGGDDEGDEDLWRLAPRSPVLLPPQPHSRGGQRAAERPTPMTSDAADAAAGASSRLLANPPHWLLRVSELRAEAERRAAERRLRAPAAGAPGHSYRRSGLGVGSGVSSGRMTPEAGSSVAGPLATMSEAPEGAAPRGLAQQSDSWRDVRAEFASGAMKIGADDSGSDDDVVACKVIRQSLDMAWRSPGQGEGGSPGRPSPQGEASSGCAAGPSPPPFVFAAGGPRSSLELATGLALRRSLSSGALTTMLAAAARACEVEEFVCVRQPNLVAV